MRVIFFGTSAFAVPSLERLVSAGHEIGLCVTRPDRPRGRGLAVAPSPVKLAAQRLALPLAQPERLDGALASGITSDVGVVASYGALIPAALLCVPRHGLLGVHPSLLPRYRGAAPIAWAVLQGEGVTGITIFRLNDRLDAGEIVRQEALDMSGGETTQGLTERLARVGAESLVQALAAIAEGRASFTPQDESKATLAPKLTKAQGRLDWRQPAVVLDRVIRAVAPWPGATTVWRGKPFGIVKALVQEMGGGAGRAGPGTVVKVSREAIVVQTGEGALALVEVQPADRRRMTVAEFLAGHPMPVGERLGEDRDA